MLRTAVGALFLIASSTAPLVGRKQPATQAPCKASNLGEENPARAKAIEEFWRRFQNALKRNDKQNIAGMVEFPLSVAFASGRQIEIRSQTEFLADYARVFPKRTRRMFLRYPAECINRVGAKGFSIAEGQIWFDQYPNGKVKIFSMNVVVYPGE